MLKWKFDIYYFQETKLENEIELMAKRLWDCKWLKCGYLEAQRACGAIVILWDSRVWRGGVCYQEDTFNILQV